MAVTIDLSQLTDGDTGLFASAKTTGPNPYIPFIKASMEGKDAEGKGKPKAFPLPFGEIGSVTAIMRRAARDEGVSVKFRWVAKDVSAHEALVAAIGKTKEGSKERAAAEAARDASGGILNFMAVRKPSKDTVGAGADTSATGDTPAAA